MTAEVPIEESNKTTVAELSWSNLDSSFSNANDLSGFGSFSDLLGLSNTAIDEQQLTVSQLPAPINQGLEQPVVSGGEKLEVPVDQPVELQVATASQVELVTAVDPVVQNHVQDTYEGWKYNYQTGEWEVTDEAKANQWQQSYQNQVVAQQETVHVNQWQQSHQNQVVAQQETVNVNQWQQSYENQVVTQQETTNVNQVVGSAADPYPGWTYNYQTQQWEEKNVNSYVDSQERYLNSYAQQSSQGSNNIPYTQQRDQESSNILSTQQSNQESNTQQFYNPSTQSSKVSTYNPYAQAKQENFFNPYAQAKQVNQFIPSPQAKQENQFNSYSQVKQENRFIPSAQVKQENRFIPSAQAKQENRFIPSAPAKQVNQFIPSAQAKQENQFMPSAQGKQENHFNYAQVKQENQFDPYAQGKQENQFDSYAQGWQENQFDSYAQDKQENQFDAYGKQENQLDPYAQGKQENQFSPYLQGNQESNYQSLQPGWSANYKTSQWGQSAPVRQFVVTAPRTTEEALNSTAGRPPHAVTAFGFGGRLVIMKPMDTFLALEQSQPPAQVFQLSQLTELNLGYGNISGPLAGNASMKEVIKWIDEKCSRCDEDPSLASLRYLWGMLKITCQNYGNLRSSVSGPAMGRQDDNGPEAALAKLLEPAQNYKPYSACLQPMPSEQQMQATAFEVKRLLIAGKQQEALQAARNGHLWGPALLLARQQSEKLYSDTLADMALRQFQPGFPLRTITLLCAGELNTVFNGGSEAAKEATTAAMIEEWQENLAIMAANPTPSDDRIIMHLGDCLWSMRNEVSGAHLCYLVANGSFEPISDTARLCLVGADHKKFPRTYASPEAIQRTEVFEFSKIAGNSQFTLLAFQPYKLIYASILAEAGKINEAQRYCQAVLKTLKTAGHAADLCKEFAISLEERLRYHSQGSPTSLVHRIFGNIGFHKMIPTTSKGRDNAENNSRPATASSRSSGSTIVPSASMEPINDNPVRSAVPVRSISEPDFSKSPQIDSPSATTKTPNKNVFSSFVQKAIGLIRAPSREAKLGDTNKFRYDENLKCWVEEGAEAPAQAPTFAPPPTTKFVQREEQMKPREETSKPEDSNGGFTPSPAKPQQTHAMSGIPPIPPSSNHYSARARQNVRSRYVDTFNKGSVTPATSKSSNSLSLPPARAGFMPPAKFFVPSAQDTTSSVPGSDATAQDTTSSVPGTAQDTTSSVPGADSSAEVDVQVPASNGPVALASVQEDLGNGAAPWSDPAEAPPMLHSNHEPTEAFLPVPPVPPIMPVQPPVASESSGEKEASAPLIHTEKTSFGDDMQEVEL